MIEIKQKYQDLFFQTEQTVNRKKSGFRTARGNTTHIHDFCIPLDFLGIKDLKKNKKGQKNFQRP